MGAVYFIRNEMTGRIYIGKDENDNSARSRCEDHLSGDRFHCVPLREDIYDVYGIDKFKFGVIEVVQQAIELRGVESWWIRVHNAADPRSGYNQTGKIRLRSGETFEQYRDNMLKNDPRRHRIYRELPTRGEPLRNLAPRNYETIVKNRATSDGNATRFIAKCKAKGLQPAATKADFGAKVIYVWKDYSNEEHTGTLDSFSSGWAKIKNDKLKRWDYIELKRGVIFVIK
jgi:hypothetical protein